MLPRLGKDFLEVVNVPIWLDIFDQHIIDVDLHASSTLLFEHFVAKVLVGCSYIFKSKRHYFIVVQTFVNNECYILLILRCHSDLVVPWESIHKALLSMSQGRMYELIHPWEQETILWTYFVKVGIFNVNSPLTIGLIDYYNIGKPLQIIYFLNKLSGQELVHLLINHLLSFLGEAPLLLSNWWHFGSMLKLYIIISENLFGMLEANQMKSLIKRLAASEVRWQGCPNLDSPPWDAFE